MDNATKRTATAIRTAVAKLGPRGQGRRYPEALKRDVLAYLAARHEAGRGLKTTSVELGIPERSIKLWSSAPRPSGRPAFVPMVVTPLAAERPVPPIVVHAPGGIRIEGLDVSALADLVRRLA